MINEGETYLIMKESLRFLQFLQTMLDLWTDVWLPKAIQTKNIFEEHNEIANLWGWNNPNHRIIIGISDYLIFLTHKTANMIQNQ